MNDENRHAAAFYDPLSNAPDEERRESILSTVPNDDYAGAGLFRRPKDLIDGIAVQNHDAELHAELCGSFFRVAGNLRCFTPPVGLIFRQPLHVPALQVGMRREDETTPGLAAVFSHKGTSHGKRGVRHGRSVNGDQDRLQGLHGTYQGYMRRTKVVRRAGESVRLRRSNGT